MSAFDRKRVSAVRLISQDSVVMPRPCAWDVERKKLEIVPGSSRAATPAVDRVDEREKYCSGERSAPHPETWPKYVMLSSSASLRADVMRGAIR